MASAEASFRVDRFPSRGRQWSAVPIRRITTRAGIPSQRRIQSRAGGTRRGAPSPKTPVRSLRAQELDSENVIGRERKIGREREPHMVRSLTISGLVL